VLSLNKDVISPPDKDEPEDFERLLESVYGELRRIAHFHRLNERNNLTLQTTALVHEAYLSLAESDAALKPRDERHLKALTSRIIRRVLVDHWRKNNAQKRDSVAARGDPRESDGTVPSLDVGILDLDDALKRLAGHSPRLEQVVELRYFGGLSSQETADTLGVSVRTIERDWIRAKAYLLDFLEDSDPQP
jgi:RNA polymerase sigma factor (TIGR02999 family)